MSFRTLTTTMRFALAVLAFAAAGQQPAGATLLSDIIATNQSVQSGRLVFSNFAVTLLNGVPTNLIDVAPTVDASGNFGLLFTTTGIVSSGGGEIVADVTFTAATAGPGAKIQAIHQSIAVTLSGVIAAFDITKFGPTPVLLSNCVNGDRPGCPQNVNPTDDATLSPTTSAQVDRQVQLQGTKGVPSSGSINSYSVTFTVVVAPALQLSVSHAGAWTQGQTGAPVTIAVSNAATGGPTNGAVTVTETLPAGLTLASMSGTGWTCVANACSRADVLAAGASYPPITATVDVAANAATPLTNSAVAAGGGSAAAAATDSITVNPKPVLAVVKSHTGNFAQGQAGAVYNVVVSNSATAGPTNGTVTVTETLPAGLTLASMTGTGWTCAAVACTRADVLAAGAAYPPIAVTVNVAANAASPLVNTVSVSGGNSVTATAADSTVIGAKPVLAIAKSHAGNFTPGQAAATYTIVVSNAAAGGPTSGTVTVTDTLPAGLALVSMAGTGWTCTGSSCARADVLPAGASYASITVTVSVAANAASPLVNTASVSGGGSAPASASDVTIISAGAPVLHIVKSHAGNFAQGQKSASYSVTVSNAAGAGPTSGTVTVTETLPAGLTLVSMSGSGWSCSSAICSRADALAGGAAWPSITVSVNVAANAASPQVNSVSVSGGGSAGATATDSTTVTLATALLSIAKSHSGNFTPGQTGAAYTIAVSNAAGAAPTNSTVTVTDTLPTGLTLVSMTGAGWSCGGNSCKRSDALAGGASYPPVTVLVNVAANASPSVVNTAAVSGGGSVNATATDPTTIVVNSAILSITKSHTGSFTQGQTGALYTVVVSNAANASPTTGTVTMTETVPAGLTLVSMSGTGWTCAAATCSRADALAAGASYPAISVTVNVAATAASPQVNAVTVSGGGSPAASASDSTVIASRAAALSISKSHAGNFTPGQTGVTYTLLVANAAGAAPTAGTVTVTEAPPAGLTLVSMAGTGWTCTANTCSRADALGAGASYPAITVTANVAPAAVSPLVNVATVSGGGSAGASAADSTIVAAASPALTITKSHVGNFTQGQANATYTVTVANGPGAGPTNGTVTVAESVPAGLSLISMRGTGWTCAGVSCTRADSLSGGASYPAITVTVNVAANAVSPVVNLVAVSGGNSPSASASDPAVILAKAPILSIVSSHTGNFTHGQLGATYTLVVSNAALAPATNSTVSVSDSLPAGLTLISMSGTGWTCSGNSCKRTDALAAGASYPPITLTVDVAATAGSPVVNTVTVSGGGSNSATASDSTIIAP